MQICEEMETAVLLQSNTVMVNPRLTLSAVLRQRYACALPAAAQITLNAVEDRNLYHQQESWVQVHLHQ
jgi:hypothetical protein